ncbi:signal transduction histidine kinase with CheB and CheR activity [Caballeronia pedi]|uniref:histidine kinase n=1 Tax=Caballeronia pedi TaxID=1777141 RepID=A0A158E942_9BURK|nr:signal transduction histidine kinase with CheB and CheR activity [Caballeronia pedi]
MFLALSEAIRQVRQEGVSVRKTGVRTAGANGPQAVSLEVHPLQTAGMEGRWLLIFFENGQRSDDLPAPQQATLGTLLMQTLRQQLGRRIAAKGADPRDDEIARLNAELGAMRTQMRTMLEEHESAREELKSSEEELLSSNEEFQSTNEELETAKEELQSLNEELLTTNDELRYRNRELRTVHDEVTSARDYADAIIETMSEPLLVLQPDLRVTRANRAFYETFRTTADVTIGTLLYTLGNGQWNIPSLRELLETILPQQAIVRDFPISHDFPRIGPRTMRLNAARVVVPAHELILMTIEDVTQHQLAVERLQAADRHKDEFLAMLGHELRNPLAAVGNGLEIWGRADVEKETQDLARAAATRQLHHEIGLVNDLLDVSRVTRGIIKLSIAPVDLVQIVQQSVTVLHAEVQGHQHELVLSLPTQPILIDGDAMRLEQVVTNLLSNAIKYTRAGGRIRISLMAESGEAVLTVTDNGIGMTADFLPNIFTIFVQAECTLDRKSAGLGLGLALVQQLVEMHHGTVRASSEGLGQGSVFVVRLPISNAQTLSSPKQDPAEDASVSGAPKNILVVDDNTDAAESTAMVLRLDGHDVKVAIDGTSALQVAADSRPDVVLLDIGLPDMNGYEICHQLRTMPECAGTLLIALSGYAGEEYRERARQAGFHHYMVKPADLSELNRIMTSSCVTPKGADKES